MKHPDNVAFLIEKYRLNNRTSLLTKLRILNSKRKAHARIVMSAQPGLRGVRFGMSVKYILRAFGSDLSLNTSIRVGFASIVLCFAAATAIISGVLYQSSHTASRFSAVAVTSGTVGIQRGASAVRSDDKIELSPGDTVTTGPASSALVRFSSHDIMILHDSICRFETSGPGIDTVRFNRGEIMLRNAGSSSGSGLEVITPNAQITVKGTLFSVSVDADTTTVQVKEGSVAVRRLDSADKRVVSGGEQALVNSAIEVKPSGKLTDERLAEYGKMEIPADGQLIRKSIERTRIRLDNIKDEGSFPMTIDQLKEKYGHVEEIVLFNGQVIIGSVVSRAEVLSVATANGMIRIPAGSVQGMKTMR